MLVGIFWPQSVYEARIGRAMNTSEMRVYTHNGRNIRGIMLSDDAGYKPGCIKVPDLDEKAVSKVSTVVNSDTSFDQNAVGDTVAKACQIMQKRITVETDDDTGMSKVNIKQSHKKLFKQNSSSSESAVWVKTLTAPTTTKRKYKPDGKPSTSIDDRDQDHDVYLFDLRKENS